MAPKETPPPGVRALNISNKQMEKYGLKTGTGRKDVMTYQMFKKDEMLEEVSKMGFYSAWNDIRKEVDAYPDAELLVVADLDEKYGENWWIALTPEAKDSYFEQFKEAEKAAEAERLRVEEAERKKKEDEEALERVVVLDAPKSVRPYISATAEATERAVQYMTIRASRPLLSIRIQRKRALFGGRAGLHDRDSDKVLVDVRSRKDPRFDVVRKEQTIGVQVGAPARGGSSEGCSQTTYFAPAFFSAQTDMDRADDTAAGALAPGIMLDAPLGPTPVDGGRREPLRRRDPDVPEPALPSLNKDLLAVLASVAATVSCLTSGGAEASHRDRSTSVAASATGGRGGKGLGRTAEKGPLARLLDFLSTAVPLAESALSQNETLNIFSNELASMAEGGSGSTLGAGAGEGMALREERQFMDLVLTAHNDLPCVEWHPRNPAWLAVAAAPRMSFEARLVDACLPRVGHVLLFTTGEFTAQAVLDCPADVTCMAWHPADPLLLAVGTAQGSIALFDLSAAMAKIASIAKGGHEDGDGKGRAPHVSPRNVTSIEGSHAGPVLALRWLPTSHHISHRGALVVDKELGPAGTSAQIMSVGGDGLVAIWDTRYKQPDRVAKATGGRRRSVSDVSGIPQPLVSTLVPGAAAAGVLAPPTDIPWMAQYKVPARSEGRNLRLSSASFPWSSSANPSSTLCTDPLLLGTVDGRVAALDWAPSGEGTNTGPWTAMAASQEGAASAGAKGGDDDTGSGGGGGGSRMLWLSKGGTDRPPLAVLRSPLSPDLLLVLHEFTWSLYRAGIALPVLSSPASNVSYSVGTWSPTRHAVFLLGTSGGALESWDLLDSTAHPASSASLVSAPLTCIQFRGVTGPAPFGGVAQSAAARQPQQIAVGDAKGSLHVMEVPPALRRGPAHEEAALRSLLERESSRVGYVSARGAHREGERARKEALAATVASKKEQEAAKLESDLTAAKSALLESDPAGAERYDLAMLAAAQAAKERSRAQAAYRQLQDSICMELGVRMGDIKPLSFGDRDGAERKSETAGLGPAPGDATRDAAEAAGAKAVVGKAGAPASRGHGSVPATAPSPAPVSATLKKVSMPVKGAATRKGNLGDLAEEKKRG